MKVVDKSAPKSTIRENKTSPTSTNSPDNQPTLSANHLLQLQKQIGNQKVLQLLTHLHRPAPHRHPKQHNQEQGFIAKSQTQQSLLQRVIQRVKGGIWPNSKLEGGYEVTSKTGHGPYTIRNIKEISNIDELEEGTEVDYENMKDGSVIITSVNGVPIKTEGYDGKKQKDDVGKDYVDLTYKANNNLGLKPTDKINGRDRPWLLGQNFSIDFENGGNPVDVNAGESHNELHEDAPKSGGFRGNSVTLSWTLYYEEKGEIRHKEIKPKAFNDTYYSADFGKYKKNDVDEMFSLGRTITNNKGYKEKENKPTATARYHSERDFVVKANRTDLVDKLAEAVIAKIGKKGTPQLLLINLHSHELRICNECYQFLDAFMEGSWIDALKKKIPKADSMKVSMLTSADNKHPDLVSSNPTESYEDGHAFTLSELPTILNIDLLKQQEDKDIKRKFEIPDKEKDKEYKKPKKLVVEDEKKMKTAKSLGNHNEDFEEDYEKDYKEGFQDDIELDDETALRLGLQTSVFDYAEHEMGATGDYEIGEADGSDNNCSIISVFAAAGQSISSEKAMFYRQQLGKLGVEQEDVVDINEQIKGKGNVALEILNYLSSKTGVSYSLMVVHGKGKLTEMANNGGEQTIFIILTGIHFSPAFPKKK